MFFLAGLRARLQFSQTLRSLELLILPHLRQLNLPRLPLPYLSFTYLP